MEGKISLPQLVKAFRELQSRSASGILHITADSEERRIYFHGGRIVGAKANDDEEASTEEQRAIVRAVFLLRDGDYRFEEKSGIEVESSALNIAPGELTVMSSHPEEVTESAIGWSENAPLELRVRVAQLESTLSTKQVSLLDVMKDRVSTETSMTTSDVIGMSLLTKEETIESLGALIAAGIVQVTDDTATACIKNSAVSRSNTFSAVARWERSFSLKIRRSTALSLSSSSKRRPICPRHSKRNTKSASIVRRAPRASSSTRTS